MRNEVKVCPFCGNEASLIVRKGFRNEVVTAFVCCQGCGSHTKEFSTVEGAKEAWNTRIPRKQEAWIPTKESLPEDGQWVLCTTLDGDVMKLVWVESIGLWWSEDGISYDVIAWQSLPEPYQPVN